jgi:release factor glutamine methyltransferase
MLTIKDVLLKTSEYFKSKDISTPRLDAELLIGHILNLPRIQLYMSFDKPLKTSEIDDIRSLVRRRATREPIAYIVGEKGFYKFDFDVIPGVLCPRPDTETIVEVANNWIPKNRDYFICDVGSGSGCIGLSLLLEHPNTCLFATDISDAALQCTQQNVERHNLNKRAAVLKGQYLSPVPNNRAIDLVVSNPPYIPSSDIEKLAPEVSKHEPRMALDGGADGLDCYRKLIADAASRVRDGIIVEIGLGQEKAISKLMHDAGLIDIEHHTDLTNRIRVVSGRKPSQ